MSRLRPDRRLFDRLLLLPGFRPGRIRSQLPLNAGPAGARASRNLSGTEVLTEGRLDLPSSATTTNGRKTLKRKRRDNFDGFPKAFTNSSLFLQALVPMLSRRDRRRIRARSRRSAARPFGMGAENAMAHIASCLAHSAPPTLGGLKCPSELLL